MRPRPSSDAIAWLLPSRCAVAVDLAAGTGLLSRVLVRFVRRVLAIEPDARMAAVLRARSPGVTVVRGVGERLPLADASVDAVLVSSAWHWLDQERAVPELGRVLRDGGRLGVLRTSVDRDVAWLRELRRDPVDRDGADSERGEHLRAMAERYRTVPETGTFGNAARESFRFTRPMTADDFTAMLATYSGMITASEDERAARLARVRASLAALFPDTSEIDIPMRTECWRAERLPRLTLPYISTGTFLSARNTGPTEGAGMTQPDAAPEPYDQGMLDVGDGNQVYWQVRGTPGGKPAVVVHGGPGGGFHRGGYRGFDRAGYQLILFDQRGCGDSTPNVSDPATDLRHNTTQHLIADMERLREHLGIERWLLYGYSWGTVLSLAYAEQHPEHVSEIILAAIFGGRRRDIDWMYRDAGRFYPEQWERFWAGAAGTPRDGDILGTYARLVADPDPAVRAKATADWCAWEDALLSSEPQGKSGLFRSLPPREQFAVVRLCAHYFSHGLFLEDGVLIREAGRLAGIPGVLVHGRMDMNGPPEAVWELSRAWPDAELLIAEDAGHLDSETKVQYIREAVKRFADR